MGAWLLICVDVLEMTAKSCFQTPLHPGLISAITATAQPPSAVSQLAVTATPPSIQLSSILPPALVPPLSTAIPTTFNPAAPPMPTSPVSSVMSGCGSSGGEAGPESKSAKKSKKSSQQKGCPPLTPVDASGNRKYKQYTDETLQQALKDVAEGQSINR